MKKWKSYIAYVISGCMLLTAVPVQTFAEEQTATTSEAEEMSTEVLEQETTAVTYDEAPVIEEKEASEETTEVFQEEWETTTEQEENRAGTSDFTDIENPIFIQDSCGSDASFQYEIGTDTLYIMGQGEMYDYGQDEDKAPWREYEKEIKHIVIDSGITKIGTADFWYMTQVISVTLPDTLNEIGETAFCGCYALEEIAIPNSVTKIGFAAFAGCYALEEIVIPDSVTELADCLGTCPNLKSVTLPKNLTVIPWGMFADDSALTNIQIPENVTVIESYSFAGCTSLSEINIPKKLTTIDKRAFEITALTSLTLPESVENIEVEAFLDCSDLKEVTILSPKYNIGDHAFGYRMKGADSYEKIDGFTIKAYRGTQGETYAKDNGFTFIALDGEEKVTSGKCGDNAYWKYDEQSGLLSITGSGEMYDYKHDQDRNGDNVVLVTPWRDLSVKKVKISGITSIGEDAFYHIRDITEVTMSDSVIKLGRLAFCGCSSLRKIKLSSSLKEIPDFAFYRCDFSSIELPSSLKKINGHYAFSHNHSLSAITIPESVEHISMAFVDCPALKEITILNKNAKIENTMLGYPYDKDVIELNITIKGYTGSTAEAFVKQNKEWHKECKQVFYALDKAENIAKETINITAATPVKTGMKLTWSYSANADTYTIYRKNGSGKYTVIGTLAAKSGLSNRSPYIDTSVKSGTSYTYKVIASYQGVNSKAKEKTAYYLSEPTITLKQAASGITVSWTKVTGASGYYIYRKVENGKYVKVTTAKSTAKSYTDKKAVEGKRNTYKVYAYKSSPKAQSSFTEKSVLYLKATRLTLNRKTVKATSIALKWTKVAGAKGYYIYRKSGKGSYQKIATIQKGTTLKYTDKTVKKNVKYTYYVVAYNGKDVSPYTTKTK